MLELGGRQLEIARSDQRRLRPVRSVRTVEWFVDRRGPNEIIRSCFLQNIKALVLGLGYGMGAKRFAEVLGTDEMTSKEMVTQWRTINNGITKLWATCDQDVFAANKSADRMIELEMPTGDKLRHFDVQFNGRDYISYTIRGDKTPASKQSHLWGGVLVENMTQRMARDILGEAVIKIEEAGIPCL